MVEDRIEDPVRIGQLLASELTGLDAGRLGAVSVVDADPDATPSPAGTHAFTVEFRGGRIGTVRLFPDAVAVRLDPERLAAQTLRERIDRADIELVDDGRDGVHGLRIESGAAVKRAVDALAAALPEEDD